MSGYGWSYLTVAHDAHDAHDRGAGGGAALFTTAEGSTEASPAPPAAPFRVSDGSSFMSESEMLRELGVTGWELVAVRQSQSRLVYYFKRPRA